MFSSLQQQMKALNSDVKSVATCEKAKKLRKKLLTIGIPMTVLGFGGALVCFILFGVLSFQKVNSDSFEFDGTFLIPFFCIIPCAFVGAIGAGILSTGLKIVIADYVSTVIEEAVGLVCPVCKATVAPNAKFCGSCGTVLIKKCPNCQKENPLENGFCVDCGTPLT